MKLNNLIERLEKFQEKTGMSISKIANGIGRGSSTISEWKNGKYKGDLEKLEEEIENYLSRHDEEIVRRIDFCVETEVTKKVFYVLDTIAEYVAAATRAGITESAKIGFISGRAGLGKTWSLTEYKKRNESKVVFITAEVGDTENVILRKIAKELRIPEYGHARMAVIKERVKDRLKGTEKMIVIDEGEHLKSKALDVARAIADQTGVGLVVAGTEKLEHQIISQKNEYEYLYSRTVIFMRINNLEEKDTKEIVKKYIGEGYTEREIEILSKQFHKYSNGSARNLSNLLSISLKTANLLSNKSITNGKITVKVVEEASKLLTVRI